MQLRQRILPQIRRLYGPVLWMHCVVYPASWKRLATFPRTLQSLGHLEADARASDEMFLGEE